MTTYISFIHFFCDYIYLFYRFFFLWLHISLLLFFLWLHIFLLQIFLWLHIFFIYFSVTTYISFIDFSVTTNISFIDFSVTTCTSFIDFSVTTYISFYRFFFSVKTHIFIDFFSVAAYISFIEFFYDYICLFYRFFCDYIYLFTWSTVSDQLSPTLICVFINTDQITWKVPLSNISNTVKYMDEQWGRFSDCAHAHADLGILCSHGMRVLVYDAERLLESVGSVVVVIYDARKVNKNNWTAIWRRNKCQRWPIQLRSTNITDNNVKKELVCFLELLG